MVHKAAAMALSVGLLLPADLPIQCEDDVYRKINPQVCGQQITPFPEFGGSSGGAGPATGGGGRSLIGRIIDSIL